MPYEYDPKTEDAIAKDRALQADPELGLSNGRASTGQIAMTAIASIAVIALLIYGVTHQRDETVATEPATTTAQGTGQPASPPAPGANNPQGETTGSGANPGAPATGRGDSSQQGGPLQVNSPSQRK